MLRTYLVIDADVHDVVVMTTDYNRVVAGMCDGLSHEKRVHIFALHQQLLRIASLYASMVPSQHTHIQSAYWRRPTTSVTWKDAYWSHAVRHSRTWMGKHIYCINFTFPLQPAHRILSHLSVCQLVCLSVSYILTQSLTWRVTLWVIAGTRRSIWP